MRRVCFLLIVAVAVAAPSSAALYMKSELTGTGPNERPNEAIAMMFEGWFDDVRAMINVLESGNELYHGGIIYVDGDTMTLHDPEENTCAPYDVQAMMRFAGAMLDSFGPLIQLEFGEPEVEVLDRRSGESMLNRRVDYLKYQADWTMSFKAPLMKKRTYQNSSVHEIWYDERLTDQLPSAGTFLNTESFTTGNEDLDQAISASRPPVEGAALKVHTVSTTINPKGNEETTTTTSKVTKLDPKAADPPGGYAPPEDCQVVSMFPPGGMPPEQGGEGGEGGEDTPTASDDDKKPWQKVKVKNPFKRNKNKSKDDDGRR